jgi:superfamily II DNA or RNA helicase
MNNINTNNLLDYQIPHVKKLVDSLHLNGFATDLSETGTGKTYSACATAREMNLPFLIICPKPVIPEWKKVLNFFGIKPLGIKNYESLIRGNKTSEFTEYRKEEHPHEIDEAGNPKKIQKLRFNHKVPSNALVIFDEVHKCKSMTQAYENDFGKTAKLLMTCRDQGLKALMVSASAATNPTEMQALGYVSRMHNHLDHMTFRHNFAVEHGAERQKLLLTFDPTRKEAQEGMQRINTYLYDTKKCASRVRIQDTGNAFPDNNVSAESLDMGNNTRKIQSAYNMMEYELAKLEERTQGYSGHVFSIIMKARRVSEMLKVPTFVDQTETYIRDNKSVAIFLNFSDSIAAVEKQLQRKYKNAKFDIVKICGGQSDKERQAAIEGFQNDTARIILCQIDAGGVGISLHDLNGKHARVSLISPNYSAICLKQALGRIFRSGAKTKCVQKIIFAADTIEERACQRVEARLNNLSLLNDGDLTSGINIVSGACLSV